MIFDFLEKKRNHVRTYKKTAPLQHIVERAIWQAWKTTPSKNSAMPYQVYVWRKQKHLNILYDIAYNNNLDQQSGKPRYNPYFEHIRTAPYLITIHQRASKPNRFYAQRIRDDNLFMEWVHKKDFHQALPGTILEVGMFLANLTCYLLEQGIDVSYNGCFRRDALDWQNAGLEMVETRPITMMSLGYADQYRKDHISKFEAQYDKKPEIDEVVEWIE